MILNDNNTLTVVNKYTKEERVLPVKHLTNTDIVTDGTIRLIMTHSIELGDNFTTWILNEKNSTYEPSKYAIGQACLYIATCCFIGQTASCKTLIAEMANTYQITIDRDDTPEDTKEVLRALVKMILDKYDDSLSKIAEEVHLDYWSKG